MEYEKLEVYQVTLSYIKIGIQKIAAVNGYAELKSQIRRASFSIALNIAEGAGKRTKNDKRKFYQIAKGSAMESAAAFDIMYKINLISKNEHKELKAYAHRIVSMLSKLIFAMNTPTQNPE